MSLKKVDKIDNTFCYTDQEKRRKKKLAISEMKEGGITRTSSEIKRILSERS